MCFAKAPLLLGQVFFLIYEGVRRRPEARRCPRPILGGGHAATVPGRVGPPLLALRHPLVSIFCPKCFFSIKNDVVFFLDFISCKNSQGRDFAKNSVRISSFIQIWKDLGANYEAKCLEKWMHFGCISIIMQSSCMHFTCISIPKLNLYSSSSMKVIKPTWTLHFNTINVYQRWSLLLHKVK